MPNQNLESELEPVIHVDIIDQSAQGVEIPVLTKPIGQVVLDNLEIDSAK